MIFFIEWCCNNCSSVLYIFIIHALYNILLLRTLVFDIDDVGSYLVNYFCGDCLLMISNNLELGKN